MTLPTTFNIKDAFTGDLYTVHFTQHDGLKLSAEIYRNGTFRSTWQAGYGHPSSLKAAWVVRKVLDLFTIKSKPQ